MSTNDNEPQNDEAGHGTSAAPITPFSQFNTPNSSILFPVVLRKLAWLDKSGNYHPHDAHQAIVRIMNPGKQPRVLNVVSNTYKLVHNRELVQVVENTMLDMMQLDLLRDVRVHDRVSHYGRTCYREYVFPHISADIGSKSRVALRIIVQNGYGGSALRVYVGAIEFYCSNGMISGKFEQLYHRHTSGLKVERIGDTMQLALAQFDSSLNLWKKWTRTPLKHSKAMDFLRSVAATPKLGDALAARYLDELDARGENVFTLYSTLTYYASHDEGEFKIRNSAQDSVASVMMSRELEVSRWTESKEFRELVS